MTSLPELYFDEDSLLMWTIGFYCVYDDETHAIFAPMYEALIDEVTQGVDISRLPLWPDGHKPPRR
jgi:hypothetical protein